MAAPVYFHKEHHPHTANVYRLVGKNEDALSYALGHLMAIDGAFLLEILKETGILPRVRGKRYKRYLDDYSVHLQELRDVGPGGRRDIVVEAGGSNGLRVVVEAKIGRGQPDACQLLRYTVGCECGNHALDDPKQMAQAWGERKDKFIVALTRDKLDSNVREEVLSKLRGSGIELRTTQWHQILGVALDRRRGLRGDTRQSLFVGEFVNFFREHYEMNTYQAEVMVKKENARYAPIYFNGYMYVGGTRDIQLPLYFAPCFTKASVGSVPQVERMGVGWVSRVVRVRQVQVGRLKENPESVADHEIRGDYRWEQWRWGLSETAQCAKDERWPDEDQCQVYFLTEPAKLGRTVKGPSQIPPGFKTTLFELLTRDILTKDFQP
jgi:hypothetical protein